MPHVIVISAGVEIFLWRRQKTHRTGNP